MPEREKPEVYPAYFELHEDITGAVSMYNSIGRFIGQEATLAASLAESAQRLGNIFVLRTMGRQATMTVGLVKLSSDIILPEIKGLVVRKDFRGHDFGSDLLRLAEKELYHRGQKFAELSHELDESVQSEEDGLAEFYDREGYEPTFQNQYRKKRLTKEDGMPVDQIDQAVNLPVPIDYVSSALQYTKKMVQDWSKKRIPTPKLGSQTIDGFNQAAAESGINNLQNLRINDGEELFATPWQRILDPATPRKRNQLSKTESLRRWIHIPTNKSHLDILYNQRFAGIESDVYAIAECDDPEPIDGYHIVFDSHKRDAIVLDFNHDTDNPKLRIHDDYVTNFTLRSLVDGAYAYHLNPACTLFSSSPRDMLSPRAPVSHPFPF